MSMLATEPRQEANFRTDLESDLALGMLPVVEAAAIAVAHTMGRAIANSLIRLQPKPCAR